MMFRTFHTTIIFIALILGVMADAYGHKRDSLPVRHLEFVANHGQWHQNVKFQARLAGGAIFAEADGMTFVLLDQRQLDAFNEAKMKPGIIHDGLIDAFHYQLKFIGCNPDAKLSGQDALRHHYNYFTGNDKRHWASRVPAYHEIYYHELYPGIQLRYYQQNEHLKYEFRLAPEADPSDIRLDYDGPRGLSLVEGNLLVRTDIGQVIEMAPYAYQIDDNGDTLKIDCQFVLKKNTIRYKLGTYKRNLALVIDPVLIFSTFSGSSADNWGYTATYDNNGHLYGGGIAFSIGYPTDIVPHHYQIDYAGGSCDVAVSKFDSTGTFLLYSTYLGGTQSECPHSLYVNDNGELYVLGTTGSVNFPYTSNAYDTLFNYGQNVTVNTSIHFPYGTDIFISKFSANGDSLLASTFVGGSGNDGLNIGTPLRKNYADESRGEIIIDRQSNVYVASCTYSDNFPVTDNVFQTMTNGDKEGCVFKMDQNLSHLIWSSYIGGSGQDACYSLDIAGDNSVYVCGGTTSHDLLPSNLSFQSQYGGGLCDGFVAHISANGNVLQALTYLGKTDYDQAYLVKLSRHNHPYIFGQTNTSGNAWIINASYGQPGSGQFIMQMNSDLDSCIWSTVFGTGSGQPDISPTALLVDLCNTVYMSGWGSQQLNGFGGTHGLPITANACQATTDGSDYYFICISDDGSGLVYGSFFGSPYSREHVDGGTSRFDRKGRIYQAICAGCGGDSNFPTTPGSWSETNGSINCNLGVVKMDFNLPTVVADFSTPSVVCHPDVSHFTNHTQAVSPEAQFYWDFGDGTHSTLLNPTHQYIHGGLYIATLHVTDTASCNLTDSISKEILVLNSQSQTLESKNICAGDFVQIGLAPSSVSGISYHWTPSGSLSDPNVSNPIAAPNVTTLYRLIISANDCNDTIWQTVNVENLQISATPDTTRCEGESITLGFNVISGQAQHIIWSLHPDYSNPIAENVQQITVTPASTTHYYLQVQETHCSVERDITVDISSVQINAPEPRRICFEDSIQLSIQANGGQLSYQWTPTTGILSGAETAQPWVYPSSSTTYTVLVSNDFGCTASASIPVTKRIGTFANGLEAWCSDDNIIEGATTELFSTTYEGTYSYTWTPSAFVSSPHNASTAATPSATTTFSVNLTDEFGCTLTAQVEVKVNPLQCGEPLVFIPNSFTPNGDGKNDILFVRSTILKEFTFRIYDRWGALLFESKSLDEGWNGTYKGKPCQQGVYDYYFIGTCINDEKFVKKGDVMLLY